MEPTAPTDAQLDAIIDQSRLNLREALRRLMAGSPYHIFPFAAIASEGVKPWQINCIVANEPSSKVLLRTAQGIGEMMHFYLDARTAAAAPEGSGGLKIPGA